MNSHGRKWRYPGRVVWAAALALAGLLSALGAHAQGPRPVVKAQTYLATDAAHAGKSLRAAVVAQVEPGYHVNAHHPTFDYLIPTELTFEPAAHLSVRKTVYPPGKLVSFTFSDARLSVYEGTVKMGALLAVARGTPPGDYTLEGKLHYQACNDHACLAPASVPIHFEVRVVSGRVAVQPAHPEIFEGLKLE